MKKIKYKIFIHIMIAIISIFSSDASTLDIEAELDFIALKGQLPPSNDPMSFSLPVTQYVFLSPRGNSATGTPILLHEDGPSHVSGPRGSFTHHSLASSGQSFEVNRQHFVVTPIAANSVREPFGAQAIDILLDNQKTADKRERERDAERINTIAWQRKVRQFQAELAQKGYALSFRKTWESVKEIKAEENFFFNFKRACENLHRVFEARRLMDNEVFQSVWKIIEPLISRGDVIPAKDRERALRTIKFTLGKRSDVTSFEDIQNLFARIPRSVDEEGAFENLAETCQNLHLAEIERKKLPPENLWIWQTIEAFLHYQGEPQDIKQWDEMVLAVQGASLIKDLCCLAEIIFKIPGTENQQTILKTLGAQCLELVYKEGLVISVYRIAH